MKTFLSLLRISRPYYLLLAVAPPIAGYLTTTDGGQSLSTLLLIASSFALLGASAWSTNEICDIASDRLGSTKRIFGFYVSGGTGLLAQRVLSTRKVIAFSVITIVAGIIIATTQGPSFLILASLWAIIGLLYSIPPVRLKERGILGNALTGLAYGLLGFYAGWNAGGGGFSYVPITFGALMSVAVIGYDGLAHLVDYKVDRTMGVKTYVVRGGPQKSRRLLANLQILPILSLMFLGHLGYLNINFLLGVPLMIVSLVFSALTIHQIGEQTLLVQRLLGVPLIAIWFFIIL